MISDLFSFFIHPVLSGFTGMLILDILSSPPICMKCDRKINACNCTVNGGKSSRRHVGRGGESGTRYGFPPCFRHITHFLRTFF